MPIVHLSKEACFMIRTLRLAGSMLILFPVLTACVIGAINTREEFVAAMKTGGPFKNVEQVTVNRPMKAVVADVSEYANKCLKVRTTRAASYQYKEVGGTTTYLPKIETTRTGATALSVQEKYNDRDQSGAPPGGFFSLVAEIRSAGTNKTQVDIYHNSRSKIADPLKQWIAGDKRLCPAF